MSSAIKTAWGTMFATMSRQPLEADVCFENAQAAFTYIEKETGTAYEGKIISIKSTSIYKGVEYLKGIYMVTGYGNSASIMYACNGDNAKNKVEVSCDTPVIEYKAEAAPVTFTFNSNSTISSTKVTQKNELGSIIVEESLLVGDSVNVASNLGKTTLEFKFTFEDGTTETQEYVIEQILPLYIGVMADVTNITSKLSELEMLVSKDHEIIIGALNVEENEKLVVFASNDQRTFNRLTSRGFYVPMTVKEDEVSYSIGEETHTFTIYESDKLKAGSVDDIVLSMEFTN
ncbi:MAG: hypothetical protein IKU01_02515 [Bacteroidales bacterium]|nr:hypothetical protein [Bacteroidales bacterium]